MSNVAPDVQIVQVAGDPVNWTLCPLPGGNKVSSASVRCAVNDGMGNPITPVDIIIRADEINPATEDRIPAGCERTFKWALRMQRAALFYFRMAQGTGPIVVVTNA
jgi:hypothetical protein